ncbi:MAG: 2-amino-4-hydroxy-6-hydroxymethyldihydropteridine diphosphokinase [Planctomycetota bacterium]|jgi:2-amino-4-hydroxy-6-hydroxymethyldihydropteridine diphosphokinase
MTDAPPVTAFVGLGSNLGDRRATIRTALARLGETGGVRVVRCSTIIETQPVGPVEQGAYLNAAAELVVTIPARALLLACLSIERSFGRDRGREIRWGPRRIDLDLLLYGTASIEEPGLTVPHPRLADRDFVLEPLAEIAPRLVHPAYGVSIQVLRERRRSRGDRECDRDISCFMR